MGFYKTLCVLMGPFWSFLVPMRPNKALWVFMGRYWSLCVLMGPCKSLCVFMCLNEFV